MSEAALYGPIQEWVNSGFRQRFQWRENSNFCTMNVSQLDWLAPSGKWMHPDLAFVHVHRRTFDPVPQLDLHTFEIKPENADLLQALHQTLAHTRIADFVYLVAPSGRAWKEEVRSQARRFGVGLIEFEHPHLHGSYSVLVEAARANPDADLRSQFLDHALAREGMKQDVLRWLGVRSG